MSRLDETHEFTLIKSVPNDPDTRPQIMYDKHEEREVTLAVFTTDEQLDFLETWFKKAEEQRGKPEDKICCYGKVVKGRLEIERLATDEEWWTNEQE